MRSASRRRSAPALGGLVLLAPALATRSTARGLLTRDYLASGALTPADGFAQLLPDDDPVRYGSIARNAERQLDALIERLDEQRAAARRCRCSWR